MNYSTISVIICAAVLLMGISNSPYYLISKNYTAGSAIQDTLATSELKNEISGILPDLSSLPDSLLFKAFADTCSYMGFNMPVFEPDKELTASMPQLKPEHVDKGIFIPRFLECMDALKGNKRD